MSVESVKLKTWGEFPAKKLRTIVSLACMHDTCDMTKTVASWKKIFGHALGLGVW
jgi:hypothetical protein